MTIFLFRISCLLYFLASTSTISYSQSHKSFQIRADREGRIEIDKREIDGKGGHDNGLHSKRIHSKSHHLDSIYNSIRYVVYIDSLPLEVLNENLNGRDNVVRDLIRAYYYQKGASKNETLSYQSFLAAFNESEAIGDTVLICESLKGLMAHQLFQNRDEQSFYEYLRLHKDYAYDRIEVIYNEYYRLRSMIQFSYIAGRVPVIDNDIWISLLEECEASSYYRLETNIRSVYAVHLEINEKDFEKAREIYESSIISAAKIDDATYEHMRFTALSNIGAMYMSENSFPRALEYLNKAQSERDTSNPPFNLIIFYNWLSDVHKNLGATDSAYYYLKKAYDTNTKYELNKHNIAVNEIQEKYQNETLKVDLMERNLQRNRYFLMAWIFGGLFIIGSIVYFFYARIAHLKRLNLQQSLKSEKKESLLRAVNAKIDGEESERKRVASVLHDNIATHLAASRLHLQVIKKEVTSKPNSLQKADQLLGEISSKVRQLSHELYPPALYQLGLIQAIESLCEKYTNDRLRFRLSNSGSLETLSKEQRVRMYFIIQEIINNVIKHSEANLCEIIINMSESIVTFQIIDNGIGGVTMNDKIAEGLGLYSVQARIEDMKGTMLIQSPLNEGTKIMITIPISLDQS